MAEDRKEYPIATIEDISRIPADALPRFIAELPAILRTREEIRQALPEMAAAAMARAPWFMRWLPVSWITASMERQMTTACVWVDDDKGNATVSIRMRRDDPEPLYKHTEKMDGTP